MFRGKTGIDLNEWIDEAQACMSVRRLARADQAFFLYDHLEGEAREELKYRPTDRADPDRIIAVLKEVYGCSDSYVALQEAFFSRKQQEGETLQEFSLALMSLMSKVKERAPSNMTNTETLLRDQFVEYVLDGALRRELKQKVRREPASTLLEVRTEAIRWEREGLPGGARGRSLSVPSAFGIQYGVHGNPPRGPDRSQSTEVSELKELLKVQQEQLKCQQQQLQQLNEGLTLLQNSMPRSRSPRDGPLICRRCQQHGHFARDCTVPLPFSRFQPSGPTPPPAARNSSSTPHSGN
ncbi:uncharacterized protein LOC134452902 isoform X2 [Engraulis encrasicolus]